MKNLENIVLVKNTKTGEKTTMTNLKRVLLAQREINKMYPGMVFVKKDENFVTSFRAIRKYSKAMVKTIETKADSPERDEVLKFLRLQIEMHEIILMSYRKTKSDETEKMKIISQPFTMLFVSDGKHYTKKGELTYGNRMVDIESKRIRNFTNA